MITLKDIAEMVGVSQATVSLALSEKKHNYQISEVTKAKIRKTAEKLGYCPNLLARSVLSGQTNMIGYACGGITTEYDGQMFTGFATEARKRSYNISLVNKIELDTANKIAVHCLENRFRALICRLDDNIVSEIYTRLAPYGIPVGVMASSFSHPWGVRVVSDDYDGMRQIVEHLTQLGHKRIAHITHSVTRGFAYERRQGFIDAMLDCDQKVSKDLLITCDMKLAGIEARVTELLRSSRQLPTAITCGSDNIALVVIKALYNAGLKVPDDISVAGFGNLNFSKFLFPPLTTVDHPCPAIGKKTAELLIGQCEKPKEEANIPAVEAKIPVEIVIRESTAPPIK